MKIAVLGYGKQGRAAIDYWQVGNELTVCDKNELQDLPPEVNVKVVTELIVLYRTLLPTTLRK